MAHRTYGLLVALLLSGAATGPVAGQTATAAGTAIPIQPVPYCRAAPSAVEDQAEPGASIAASSDPELGMLFPLSLEHNVSTAGNVGMGAAAGSDRLTVAGTIESLRGGFRFPNGSVMTTAQLQGPDGIQGVAGAQGDPGPVGPPGVPALDGLLGPNLTLAASGVASVSTAGNTLTVGTTVARCLYRGKTYTTGARCYLGGNNIGCSAGTGFHGSFMTCQGDGSWQMGNVLSCINPWPNPTCGE